MTRIFNPQWSLDRRRQLRRDMTGPERILWNALRAGQIGAKFRRQVGISGYIADFYCPKARLVIEVDGDSHFEEAARAYDAERDAFMAALGLRVLKITNEEVTKNIDGVLERITESIS
ncbi:MAG: endonuclease domain-containing protein [Patescibacteria group bacterium]